MSLIKKVMNKPTANEPFVIETAIIPLHVFEGINEANPGEGIEESINRIKKSLELASKIGELNGQFASYIEGQLQLIEEAYKHGGLEKAAISA